MAKFKIGDHVKRVNVEGNSTTPLGFHGIIRDIRDPDSSYCRMFIFDRDNGKEVWGYANEDSLGKSDSVDNKWELYAPTPEELLIEDGWTKDEEGRLVPPVKKLSGHLIVYQWSNNVTGKCYCAHSDNFESWGYNPEDYKIIARISYTEGDGL